MVSQNIESFQKIYVNDSEIVTFQCPVCKNTKEANISKYLKHKTSVTFKVKCSCGNSHPVILERRKFYRKNIKLYGKFIYRSNNGQLKKGSMTVLDISRGGIKIRALELSTVKEGDNIEVEFYLDNKKHTLIKKEVIVKKANGHIINTKFDSYDSNAYEDKEIGFYLF
jgi:hypothetical protein